MPTELQPLASFVSPTNDSIPTPSTTCTPRGNEGRFTPIDKWSPSECSCSIHKIASCCFGSLFLAGASSSVFIFLTSQNVPVPEVVTCMVGGIGLVTVLISWVKKNPQACP